MSVNKVNSDGSLTRVAGGTLYADAPIGTISPFGGSVIPNGYLLCNGQAVSRIEYSELFAVIGTAFGKGNESTTFNVPDLREAVPKGTGLNNKGAYHYDNDGIALGEFVDDRIKSHAHNVYVRDTGHYHGTDSGSSLPSPNNLGITKNAGGVGWGANPVAGTASNTQSVSANIQVSSKINFGSIDNATTANGYATNEVKAVGVNYIIKAKQISIPSDFKDAVDDLIKDTTVDAVTNGDMNPITSNAVYGEFKKMQSQIYEGYGFIINSNNGEIGGYGHIIVTLKNGIAEINFSARIQDNNGSSTFNWGLNRDLLNTLIPNLPDITPIGNYSNLQFFGATGAVLVDLMGFGAMASVTNQFWTPARMYKTDGSTGTWGSDQFPANSYITGTVYGVYTV